MNQILDYSPIKNSGGGSSGSDKIVRVFAIVLVCFALCLLGGATYGIYKNKQKDNIPTVATSQAQIDIVEENGKVKIEVTHEKVIDKLIYNWDSEKETTISGKGETVMSSDVELFAGEHTLYVKVIDIDGQESSAQKTIYSEEGEDKKKPKIELNITDEKKLQIIATDETAIDYVTYRWNNEEEQRVDVDPDEDEKVIKFEIDILKGRNDLMVIAVDKNNNTAEYPKTFTGVMQPDISITITEDKKLAKVLVKHENGIKEIKVTATETLYQDSIVELEDENQTEVAFDVALPGKTTKITVVATSIEETVTTAEEDVIVEEETSSGQLPSNDEEAIDISIETDEENESQAKLYINAPAGIKEIKLNINDQDYDVQVPDDHPKELTYLLDLVSGNNRFKVKVINVNGTDKEEIKEISH